MTSSDSFTQRWARWRSQLTQFPWASTWQMLRARLREDNLGLIASSLTFTTVLALVPLLTVVLALFTAFPTFGTVQGVLEGWLVQSLVPESISRQVLGYLTQFAAKASQLGLAGFSVLLATTLALILTIDRTLNHIWRVPRLRPLGQRLFMYWTALSLGPLLLGVSVALSSYALSASRGLVEALPNGVGLALGWGGFFGLAGGMAALYHYIPNTLVRWRDAWTGGLFVALCMELAKKGLALYLLKVPTYSMIYGAFATLPILLIWIYTAWTIVLLGAVIAAYLPTLRSGSARSPQHPGRGFTLAIEALQQLHQVRPTPRQGLRLAELAQRLQVDAAPLLASLEALVALGWVGRLQDADTSGKHHDDPRYLLLADPASTPLAPLLEQLLLERTSALGPLWQHTDWAQMRLQDALG